MVCGILRLVLLLRGPLQWSISDVPCIHGSKDPFIILCPHTYFGFSRRFLSSAQTSRELTLQCRLASNYRSACFCLPPIAGIKDDCHLGPALCLDLFKLIFPKLHSLLQATHKNSQASHLIFFYTYPLLTAYCWTGSKIAPQNHLFIFTQS